MLPLGGEPNNGPGRMRFTSTQLSLTPPSQSISSAGFELFRGDAAALGDFFERNRLGSPDSVALDAGDLIRGELATSPSSRLGLPSMTGHTLTIPERHYAEENAYRPHAQRAFGGVGRTVRPRRSRTQKVCLRLWRDGAGGNNRGVTFPLLHSVIATNSSYRQFGCKSCIQ